jgi:hypothetical protein
MLKRLWNFLIGDFKPHEHNWIACNKEYYPPREPYWDEEIEHSDRYANLIRSGYTSIIFVCSSCKKTEFVDHQGDIRDKKVTFYG